MPIREVVLAAILEAGVPLGTGDILRYAQKCGLRVSRSKTPRQSIQAAVWVDIKRRGEASPFLMVGSGKWKRKFWVKEHIRKLPNGWQPPKHRPTLKRVGRRVAHP